MPLLNSSYMQVSISAAYMPPPSLSHKECFLENVSWARDGSTGKGTFAKPGKSFISEFSDSSLTPWSFCKWSVLDCSQISSRLLPLSVCFSFLSRCGFTSQILASIMPCDLL